MWRLVLLEVCLLTFTMVPAYSIASDGVTPAGSVPDIAAPSNSVAEQPSAQLSLLPTTQPSESLFRDPVDGALDVGGFLSTRVGFLPMAMPITEPAVGYGFSLGLSFFHDKPKVVSYAGEPPRVIMPSITMVFGSGTESSTWAAGIAHVGVWNDGKIRYVGALGYTSLNLDWFGKGDRLGDQPISYTNDVLFLYQKITFKLGDTDFFLGPQYRLIATDASFARDAAIGGITQGQLQSQTAGLGAVLAYDSLDQPFSPTRGIRAEVSYAQQAEFFGGDFNYGRLNAFAITYIPFTEQLILGLRLDGGVIVGGNAPFYDLPSLMTRGIPRGRYVDDAALLAEAELRYDLTKRWTLIGFGALGRVAGSIGDLGSAENHTAAGIGFRYLIAREYGLRVGVDLAYSDDGDFSAYITMGTGWVRP